MLRPVHQDPVQDQRAATRAGTSLDPPDRTLKLLAARCRRDLTKQSPPTHPDSVQERQVVTMLRPVHPDPVQEQRPVCRPVTSHAGAP
jgi:hypothetical protein